MQIEENDQINISYIEIQDRLVRIKALIKSKDYKRYNLRTLNNFIIKLNQLDKVKFDEAYSLLSEYLDFIEESNLLLNPNETYQLYSNYLKPLVPLYRVLGFRIHFGWRNVLFFGVILNIFLLFFEFNFVFFVIANYLLLMLRFRSIILAKKNLNYGPLY
ncbi:MAG: hypothetical protein ACK50A_08650 [Sphingobacteriaceae bacterium]